MNARKRKKKNGDGIPCRLGWEHVDCLDGWLRKQGNCVDAPVQCDKLKSSNGSTSNSTTYSTKDGGNRGGL